MATTEQTKANRQNAQKSTGPKTDEGKAAVSQNAVKHGLFAQSVIYGENEGDYEAFHSKMFAEIDPVGAVELMLAERAVNLSWRLRRAERMQNEVIEDMIGRLVASNPARRRRECYYINKGIRLNDPRVDLDDLPLGRIATSDWSCNKVLDRMLMYERRIENSMMKTMRELERRQLIRLFQQQEAEQELEPSPSQRDEAATREKEKQVDSKKQNQSRPSAGNPKSEYLNPKRVKEDTVLKKQSQSEPGQNGVTSYVKGDYDNIPAGGADENKAKQSQYSASKPVKEAGKREKSVTAATG